MSKLTFAAVFYGIFAALAGFILYHQQISDWFVIIPIFMMIRLSLGNRNK